jgi:hypothetical protein
MLFAVMTTLLKAIFLVACPITAAACAFSSLGQK